MTGQPDAGPKPSRPELVDWAAWNLRAVGRMSSERAQWS